MEVVKNLREEAHQLNTKIYAAYLALINPRVSLLARLLLAFGLCYAISPVDLIPDFVPVFGYLDDLVVVPLVISFAYRLIPRPVLHEARLTSLERLGRESGRSSPARDIVLFAWLLLVVTLLVFFTKFL